MKSDADVVAETLVEHAGMSPVDARVGPRLAMTTPGQVARRDAIVAGGQAKLDELEGER